MKQRSCEKKAATNNKTPAQASSVIPLRMPNDLGGRVRGLAEKSRLSDADIMRMAIERGLGAVEKMFEQPAEQSQAA